MSDIAEELEGNPYIPFTPTSTAREIAVMMAFIAAFVAVTLGYLTAWRRGNAREERKEAQRRERLRAKMGEHGYARKSGLEAGDNDKGERSTFRHQTKKEMSEEQESQILFDASRRDGRLSRDSHGSRRRGSQSSSEEEMQEDAQFVVGE